MAAGCALLGLTVLVGCSNGRAILYKGQQLGVTGRRLRVSDAQARAEGTLALAQWRTTIAERAKAAPRERFDNLPPALFRARLQALAARDHFIVETIAFERPRQLAPRIVLATKHYLALAHEIPALERALDPHRGSDDRRGWAYEALYLEAQDERGIPFVIVSNAMRGPHAEGSQWARSEELYPFPHG